MILNKKMVASSGIIIMFGAMLAGCSNVNGTVAKTNFGNVTSEEVYQRAKDMGQTKSAAQVLVLEKVLEHKFPHAATDAQVNKRFKKIKKNQMAYMQLTQSFNGDDAIKDNIKDSLLLEAAMKKNVHVSDSEVKKAYKEYRPDMEMAYVEFKDKNKAYEAHDQLAASADYDQFKKTATNMVKADKDNVNAGMLPTFDSLADENTVPSEVKKAAMKLKEGETSQPIKLSGGTYGVLYMKSVANKGSFKAEKSKLTARLKEQKMTDPATEQKVLKKYVKEAHVKVEDSAYRGLMKSVTSMNTTNN